MGLDPTHARALLMQGEAILDQPLASHTAADAETILLRALEIHKAQLAAAGEGPPARDVDGRVSAECVAACKADEQLWQAAARAIEEAGQEQGSPREAEAALVLREGILWNPLEVELYLNLGSLLERTDMAAALQVYLQFPPPATDESAAFDHAVVANCAVRVLIEQQDYGPALIESLVIVGRVLGVLNIEKHIQVLDQADEVDVIKEVYHRILPDHIDQSTFFKHKGWDYERSRRGPASPARAERPTANRR
mmetsp:Transcript_31582/g.71359  ORF Transcript_31582/g.71359 Transcript_31582/m.71359 type:complete len:252 (-) Transcript_31582:358-1113(-)